MIPDISDRPERLAALDTSRSCHVEAPAGSGKTHLLTTRFLKLLGEVNHPQEILALTFTRKAAAEMRHRIQATVLRARNNVSPVDDDDALLLNLAQRAVKKHRDQQRLIFSSQVTHIMTFHSFCYTLVQRAPLESLLPPDCRIMDEMDQPALLHETIRRLQRRVLSLGSHEPLRQAFENRLLRHANNLRQFEEELKGLLLTRDRFQDLLVEVSRQSLYLLPDLLRKRLRHHIERQLMVLRDSLRANPIGMHWDSFMEDLRRHEAEAFRFLPAHLSETTWESLPSWQDMASRFLTKTGQPRKRLGPNQGLFEHFAKSSWMAMISGLPLETTDRLFRIKMFPSTGDPVADLDALVDFVILSSELIAEYDALCRTQRVVDFVGLEQAALRVVQDEAPSDLLLYLDYRIRHLLVDEFQDTSFNQWELIKGLLRGWEPSEGRTVFLVGDPKQSIFGFRNAEVSLFFLAKAGIPLPGSGSLPLSDLALKTNFRSEPKLIEWINGLFSTTVMANPRDEVDEVPFGFSKPSGHKMPVSSSLSLSLFSHRNTELAKAEEARWLASSLSDVFHQRGHEASIAVLLFNRNRLRYYLKAFNEAGLPVELQEGLPLSERPEIRYLLQISRLLTRPHDDLAWVTLLRSPWFWFNLKILHETAFLEVEGWEEKIRAAAFRHPLLMDLIRAVDRAFSRVGRDPLGDVVRKLWEQIEGPRLTAALYGMAGVANCRRFFESLRAAEEDTPLKTLARMELLLDGLYEPPDPTLSLSKIQMMTVHRAKGLEFDIVFLPYLDWKPLAGGQRSLHPYLLGKLPGLPGETLLAMGPDRRSSEVSSLYRILAAVAKERAWGEAKRLFYVALTRPKERLMMSGLLKCNGDSLRTEKGSALSWILHHEGLSASSLQAGEHKGSLLQVFVNPPYQRPADPPFPGTAKHPEPHSFNPEPLPYRTDHPATPEGKRSSALHASLNEAISRAIGTVTHRMIKRHIRGGLWPSHQSVVKSLLAEGVSPLCADQLAKDIFVDVSSTMDDPFIMRLMNQKTTSIKSEWGIEDYVEERTLRTGVLDLALFDGDTWWIVDFKTSRPSEDEGLPDFLTRQEHLYQPQLNAYRSMLASLTGTRQETIRAGLYFTSFRRWHELPCPVTA